MSSQSPISISGPRVAQVQQVLTKFVNDFKLPDPSIDDTETFRSIYHPEVSWYDHAFLLHRQGQEAIAGLRKSFTYCNQPFRTEIKAILPTTTGGILEQVWHGRHANDIVRKDGEVAVKATGKDFVCHVCMVIAIDDDGLITRIDEYYNKAWENGIAEDKYPVMR